MKIKLPTQTKTIIENRMVKKEGEEEFDIDMSLASQIRFESKFPDLATREDLFGFTKRICEIEELSAGVIISKMKMLYCWFDTDMTFINFLKLFDLSDEEYIKKLSLIIGEAFDLVLNSSAEKN